MIEGLAKALIKPLTTLAKDEFKKRRLKKDIEKAVHETLSAHPNICLPLCMDEEFSPKLFRLAQGISIDSEELVELGFTVSQKKAFGFSKSDIIDGLKQFALNLINIFEEIAPETGKIPNAFSTFRSDLVNLSLHRGYENVVTSKDLREAKKDFPARTEQTRMGGKPLELQLIPLKFIKNESVPNQYLTEVAIYHSGDTPIYNMTFDVKYGENDWINEWSNERVQELNKKGNNRTDNESTERLYRMDKLKSFEKIEPGWRRNVSATGSCRKDICDFVAKGREFLIQIKFKGERDNGSPIEYITKYKLLCNKSEGMEGFTFQKMKA